MRTSTNRAPAIGQGSRGLGGLLGGEGVGRSGGEA